MNTELVTVTPATLGGTEVLTVNARDLHAFLGVGKRFASWITERIAEYEFTENQDFAICSQNREKIGRGRPGVEYLLSLDMAKELAMVERTDKGRQVRRYFIECEQRLRAVAPEQAEAAQHAAATLTADQQTAIKELVHSRVEALAQDKRAAAAIKCWSALKSKFGCTYKRIPGAQFTEALSLVARLPLEGELLGRKEAASRYPRTLFDLPYVADLRGQGTLRRAGWWQFPQTLNWDAGVKQGEHFFVETMKLAAVNPKEAQQAIQYTFYHMAFAQRGYVSHCGEESRFCDLLARAVVAWMLADQMSSGLIRLPNDNAVRRRSIPSPIGSHRAAPLDVAADLSGPGGGAEGGR